ncbi:hypothetical protein ASC75_02650 [Aminobacter sp. DSM 101952]|uniref:DUF4365 domain-containing protein n=1 Tax=Aminobacter sp. DSM 101952 TaxID=2735891 RepID=UPI0006FE0C39|nr:DUF4365 domain-containing protein [Aminobacter sp. DSM 101952]KQU76529.1 hypothetical protein ASC75_02650 [Aminobacter sp. DSM 101952]
MPRRPRSHVLEDLAETRLRSSMRPSWILRAKDKDYGIDFEAEILAEGASDTGNLFYIQSKATDAQLPSGRKLRIKTDRLNYLGSFDAPAIVILYLAASDMLRWMWAEEARQSVIPGKETVTLDFTDAHTWDAETPAQIERTLKSIRLLRRKERLTSFPLKVASDASLALNRVAQRLRARIPFAVDGARSVPIGLTLMGASLRAEIAGIANLVSAVDPDDIINLEHTGLYLVVALLEKLDQSYHAARIAQICLDIRATSSDDALVGSAAIALIRSGEPRSAVELAMLNGLHDSQGMGHGILRLVMASPMMASKGIEDAVADFFSAAIEAHEKRSEPVGALRYSFANHLMNRGRYRQALHYYNGARRDDPGYLARHYYLKEVGGTLYLAGRYRASARFYERAVEKRFDLQTIYCLGDAQLMAGQFAQAMQSLAPVAQLETAIGAEARLKTCLAEWTLSVGVASVDRSNALLAMREDAHRQQDMATALWAHIAISFIRNNDPHCWCDALAFGMANGLPGLVTDIMRVSVEKTGLEAFSMFKQLHRGILDPMPDVEESMERVVTGFANDTIP